MTINPPSEDTNEFHKTEPAYRLGAGEGRPGERVAVHDQSDALLQLLLHGWSAGKNGGLLKVQLRESLPKTLFLNLFSCEL